MGAIVGAIWLAVVETGKLAAALLKAGHLSACVTDQLK